MKKLLLTTVLTLYSILSYGATGTGEENPDQPAAHKPVFRGVWNPELPKPYTDSISDEWLRENNLAALDYLEPAFAAAFLKDEYLLLLENHVKDAGKRTFVKEDKAFTEAAQKWISLKFKARAFANLNVRATVLEAPQEIITANSKTMKEVNAELTRGFETLMIFIQQVVDNDTPKPFAPVA